MPTAINVNTHIGPSFSLNNRIARVVWNISCFLLFRFTPNPLFRWRTTILKVFGAKVGKRVHVYPNVRIWAPWNIILDDESGIANGVTLYSQDKIYIGRRAVVSQGSHLCCGSHDYTKPGQPLVTAPISIEDNAWVAAEVFIHPGVTVGKYSVVAARSVVTKSLPPNMVCAGHPCQPIKPRIITNEIA